MIFVIDGDPADLAHDPIAGQLLWPIGVYFVRRLTILRSRRSANGESNDEWREPECSWHLQLLLLQVINLDGVFGPDFLPQSSGKFVE